MRWFFVALVLSLLPGSADELSWERAFEREDEARDLQKQVPKIEEIARREAERQPSERKQAAYVTLGAALRAHPDMQPYNNAEAQARKELQKAQAGGNSVEISLASRKLAKAERARYQKAISIPELKALIDAWQQAAREPKPAPEAQSNLEAIQEQLKALQGLLAE